MTKFRRFIATRSFAFTLTLTVLTTLIWWVCGVLILDLGIKLAVSMTIFSALVFMGGPVMNASYLMTKAAKELDNNCDPYPLLAEAEEQLTYKNLSDAYRISAFINNCLAFYSIGRTKDAIEFMEQVDIDSVNGIHKSVKFLYYNNLACFYLEIGDVEKGNFYLETLLNMREAEKSSKLREAYSMHIISIESSLAYYNKEYDKAYELLCSLKEPTKRTKVCNSIQRGRILLALGRIDEAKKELQFVCENGNKLYIAKEAADILAKI